MLKRLPWLAALIYLLAFVTVDPDIQTITEKLEKFRKDYPQEKIHLQLDRSIYMAGDTIYLKAYLVEAEKNLPSAISNILYVDLINNAVVKNTLLLPVSNGITWGAMVLNDSLPAGDYHLSAYTNWMRNFDASFCFSRDIRIGGAVSSEGTSISGNPANLNTGKNPASKLIPATNHSVQFFPEGGQMISGLAGKLGFKALGSNGLGIAVSGEITDNAGSVITSFKSAFAGMGNFIITPLPGHTYQATVKYADGATDKITLPAAAETGYALAIDNTDEDEIKINLAAKGLATKELTLVSQCNSRVITAEKIPLVNGAANTTLDKEKLPTGIVQFTLFDAARQPLAERLVFINHHDELQIALTPDKPRYINKEKATISIEVKDNLGDPVAGSFSLAITNGTLLPYNSNGQTILSNLLLTADLKGLIENPGYYFSNADEVTVLALDNLLITQGWRRFSWKDILANNYPPLSFTPEKSLSLSGKILTLKGAPVVNAKVTLLSKKGSGYFLDTVTNNNGDFIFDRLSFEDEMLFGIQAVSPTGSNDVIIKMNEFSSPAIQNSGTGNVLKYAVDTAFSLYNAVNNTNKKEARKKDPSGNNAITLQEVTLKSKELSRIEEAVAPSYNLNGPGNADQVLTYLDIPDCPDLSLCLPGKVRGVTFKSVMIKGKIMLIPYANTGMGKPMLIVVDGIPFTNENNIFSLQDIQPNDIQSIEVLRSGGFMAVYGFQGSGGVLVITTKRGGLDYNVLSTEKKAGNPAKGLVFIKVKGYAPVKEFYQPAITSTNTTAYNKGIVYWKPDIHTNEAGKAIVEFNNGIDAGKYDILVEGISGDGKLGTAHFTFQVNN